MAQSKIETILKLDGSSFKSDLSKAEKSILGFSAAAGAITTAVLAATKHTAEFYDATIKTARAAGVSVESFSALAHAAGMSGVDVEKLQKNLTKLVDPTKEQADALKKMGISTTETSGKLKNADKLFGEIADKVKSYSNASDQAAAVTKVFGEKGAGLVSMLKDGSKGLEEMRLQAELMGKVISTDAAVAAEKLNDDMSVLTGSMGGLVNKMTESVIKFINQSDAINVATKAVQSLTSMWMSLDDSTKDAIVTAGAIVTGLAAAATAVIGLSSAFAALKASVAAGTLVMTPMIAAVVGIGAVVAVLAFTVIKYWDQIKSVTVGLGDSFAKLWNDIKSAAAPLIDFVKNAVSSVQAFAGLGDKAQKAGTEISILGTIAKVVMAAISLYLKTATTWFSIVVDSVASVIRAIGDLGKAIVYLETGQFAKAGEMGAKALQEIKDSASRTSDKVVQLGRDFVTTFQNAKEPVLAAKDKIEKTKKSTEELQRAMQSSGKSALFEGYYKEFVKLSEAIDKAKEEMKSGNLSDSAISNVVSAAVPALGKIQEMAQKALQTFQQTLQAIEQMAQNKATNIARAMGIAGVAMTVMFSKLQALNQQEMSSLQKSEAAQLASLQKSETAQLAALKDAGDKKLNELRYQEEQRIKQIEAFQAERALLDNQEYQNEKARREKAFQDFLASERRKFEEDKKILDEKSLDREQRMATDELMNNDFQNYLKTLQDNHNKEMDDLASNFNADQKTKDEANKAELAGAQEASNTLVKNAEQENQKQMLAAQEASNAKIEAAKEASDARIEALRQKQIEDEKQAKKKMAMIQWAGETWQLEATKNIRATQAIVAGISGAAQAFANLAPIPFVGLPMAIAASKLIMSAAQQSAAMIRSEIVLPPAELFMADGGVLSGPSHASGGIGARLEGGEAVIDRQRTQKMQDYIDNSGNNQGITIVFEAGSIQGGNLDKKFMEDLGNTIAQRIRRNGLNYSGVV